MCACACVLVTFLGLGYKNEIFTNNIHNVILYKKTFLVNKLVIGVLCENRYSILLSRVKKISLAKYGLSLSTATMPDLTIFFLK